jgi:hypothetical protein
MPMVTKNFKFGGRGKGSALRKRLKRKNVGFLGSNTKMHVGSRTFLSNNRFVLVVRVVGVSELAAWAELNFQKFMTKLTLVASATRKTESNN